MDRQILEVNNDSFVRFSTYSSAPSLPYYLHVVKGEETFNRGKALVVTGRKGTNEVDEQDWPN